MAESVAADRVEIPSYEVGERLGSGGFGEVFAARHAVLGRDAAIKVLHAKYSANAAAVARFIAEARALTKLSHPGIVEVFELGSLPDGRHYFVMERLRGQTLRSLLDARGALPVAEALPLLRAIASAVDAAHAVGIAHRDLKPDNVFVLPDGTVKLIDFGLAKLTSEQGVTETGAVFGTPLYMSPEQCRGKRVDLRTDAYSFGALAYHVLTGGPPFRGEALELALAHLNDRPPRTNFPRRIDGALHALLAKDPADRPMPLGDAVAAMAGDRALRRRRKLKRWGVAAATLAAVGGAAWWLAARPSAVSTDRPDICSPSQAMLAGVWDPFRRAATGARFASEHRADVDATWRFVAQAIDENAGKWAVHWDAACASDEGKHDPLLHAQRLSCLERVYYTVRGEADSLWSADARRYSRRSWSWPAVDLSEDCSKVAVLRAEPPQLAPALRATAAQYIRSTFDRSEIDSFNEQPAARRLELAARTKRDAGELERLGSPYAVDALIEYAFKMSFAQAPLADQRAALVHASELAEKLHYDVGLAKAADMRGVLELRAGTLEEAERAVSRLETLYERLDRPAAIPDPVAARGELLILRSDADAGLAMLRDAGTRAKQIDYALERRVENGYFADARWTEGLQHARRNTNRIKTLLGPSHTMTAIGTLTETEFMMESGDLDGAAALIDHEAKQLETRDELMQAIFIGLGVDIALERGDESAAEQLGVRLTRSARLSLHAAWAEVADLTFSPRTRKFAAEHALLTAGPDDARLHDYAASAALALGDFAALRRHGAQSGVPSDDDLLVGPWWRALDAALAGRAADVTRLLAEIEPGRAVRSCRADGLDAIVLATVGRYHEALVAAHKASDCETARAYGWQRGFGPMAEGILLVELGRESEARPLLEMGLFDIESNAVALELRPAARFALARALYPDPARRPRAIRLATWARDSYAGLGPGRIAQRDAITAWLADPTRPVTVHFLP